MNTLLKKNIFVLLFHIKQFKRVYKINNTPQKDLTKINEINIINVSIIISKENPIMKLNLM